MKTLVIGTAAALLLGLTTIAAAENLDLEPCINGEVSPSGLYPNQAQADAATATAAIVKDSEWLGSGEDDVIAAFGGNRDDFER